MTWDDLSDGELHARLVQHGCDQAVADGLVADRDLPHTQRRIAGWLHR